MAHKSKQEITAIIACVLLAFIMWIYAMTDKNPLETQTVENIPVQLTNIEALEQFNLALVPEQNFVVSIKIRGNVMDLGAASDPSKYKIVANINNGDYLKKGINDIPIEIQKYPSGIQVEYTDKLSHYITVRLEKLEQKSVEVKVDLVGSVKEGFGYLNPITKPTEMFIRGPESVINTVSMIYGQIDINGKSNDYNGSIVVLPVDKDGKEVKYVSMIERAVDFSVPIKPAKEVDVVVKTTGSIPDDKLLKKINQSQEKVVILGDKAFLDKVKSIETESFDLSALSNTHTTALSLNLPEGIDVFQETDRINVEFVVENIIENTLRIPINIINSKEGYSYSTSVPDVSLTLRGGESIVNTLNTEGISAIVDVSNVEEGQHSLEFKINLPKGLSIIKTIPDKVSVTVTKPVPETTNP